MKNDKRLPITEKQSKVIQRIEEKLGFEFKGETRKEASWFIYNFLDKLLKLEGHPFPRFYYKSRRTVDDDNYLY